MTYRAPLGLLSRARVVDVLRRLGTGLVGRGRFSEPGDCWMRDVSNASDPRVLVYVHSFSSSAEVRLEIEAASLAADESLLGWWICRPARPSATT
ncbi:MAG: hypothetical protein DMD82_11290 [Candidatus Rokuibacteriota bacterium]|nr:MAG: hypothetical protein DMD82_11290 [Candidatus Rokubacteria bacterium]